MSGTSWYRARSITSALIAGQHTAHASIQLMNWVYMETDKIYNMDCLEGMKQIPDNSIDLVVTDPPYNTGMQANNAKARLSHY